MESKVLSEDEKDSCKLSLDELRNYSERLTREAFFKILTRLPVTSLLQCKLVSPRWHASVKDPVFIDAHMSRANEDDIYLIIFHDWPRCKLQLVQIAATFDGHQPEPIKSIGSTLESVLPDFDLVGSCNGLLCLYKYHYDDPLYIYNPFTTLYRELPKQDWDHSTVCSVCFGFGFHPKTKDYKVIKIVYYRRADSHYIPEGDPDVFVLTLGFDVSWRKIGKIPHKVIGPASEALVCGNLHWLTFTDAESVAHLNIVSFNLETEQFRLISGPEMKRQKSETHLLTLRGSLAAVISYRNEMNEIWVMKEYNVQDSWSKQFEIGNYVPRGVDLFMGMPPTRARRNGYMGRICDVFNDIELQGLPLQFQTIVHVGSFASVEATCGNYHIGN
ncbi:hypothetical protein ACFE04_004837 [Oxalis oulophora]